MKIHLLISLLFIGLYVHAQQLVDAVYLDDGSIIRGKIIEESDNEIKIESLCKNVYVFSSENVAVIKKEYIADGRAVKERGYFNFSSGGVLVGSTTNELRAPFSALMEHNYRINKYVAFGLVTGLEMLNEATAPLAINLKLLYPLKGGATAYIAGSAGRSYSLEDAKDPVYEITNSYGGSMVNAEFGLIFPSYGHLSFFIAAGYRYNELSYTREDWYLTEVDRTIYYNRISLRVGIVFY
jgi:hypothetical protein